MFPMENYLLDARNDLEKQMPRVVKPEASFLIPKLVPAANIEPASNLCTSGAKDAAKPNHINDLLMIASGIRQSSNVPCVTRCDAHVIPKESSWTCRTHSLKAWRGNVGGYLVLDREDKGRVSPSTHYWADPRNQNHQVTGQGWRWAPRFDPDIIASNSFNACDSGAHYWVSKDTGQGHRNINRVADQGLTTERIGRVSVLVNGSSYGYAERQAYAAFIKRYLLDDTDTTETETFSVSHRGNNFNVYVDFTPQRAR